MREREREREKRGGGGGIERDSDSLLICIKYNDNHVLWVMLPKTVMEKINQ